uniref:Dynamin N-terminal domain-containing protein n=1 Tax=Globisporangium ultimum (strain ATCC 200006 / CBS 805.95 / DAOM BR144) TaxID=431595 RepID=K3X8R8_GLOUD
MAQSSRSASPTKLNGDAASEVLVSGEVNRMIQVEVGGIYERLETLRQHSKFPSFDTVNIPMVLVLGNHSSGKSTFINYMLGQEVQKTGRAPTDCTFTVLVGGTREERLDGSALTRHAKYGFGDVQRRFGRELVSQIELKVVANSPLLDEGGLMVVDSPGMIDPPGASTDRTDTDRGYDFKRVVQWFAERADVILVMFDPDKPGTTFETLDVLTNSLRDLTSKVLLILNKVDDFRTVHDFARAYGALCWNLSKVTPRKDLPFIYTMYVPQEHRENQSNSSPTSARSSKKKQNGDAQRSDANDVAVNPPNGNGTAKPPVQRMLEDEFDGIRGEVIREVERAPDRATDNILNLLKSTASRLKMHATLLEACKAEYVDLEKFWKRVQIAGVLFGIGAASFYVVRTVGNVPVKVITAEDLANGTSSTPGSSASPAASTSSATAPSAAQGKHAWKESWAKEVAKSQSRFNYGTLFKIILSSCASNFAIWKASIANLKYKRDHVLEWLPDTFQRVYAQYLCKSDRIHDEITMQWKVVQPGLELALSSTKLNEFPPFQAKDKSFLNDVLDLHIPRLDRCVRDRSGDDHAYLRFKHLEKPSRSKAEPVLASENKS